MISEKDKISKVSTCFIISLFFTVMMAGGGIVESKAASEEERVSKLIEGARKEGEMVLYTSPGVADSTEMIKGFEGKYPFIKVNIYRATGGPLLNKSLAEAKAKKYTADVIGITGFEMMVLKKEGIYASYFSPESRAYPEGFKDPDGAWTALYIQPYLMGYNTKLLSRKDIPNTYEGFLDPRWKGKQIGFDTKEVDFFANMLKIMGEEKGMDFFRKLVTQQHLNYRKGHTLIADLIIAGEFPVGTVFLQSVEGRKKKGAKIEWVGVSPVIAKFHSVGLHAHAPHPNAGKLYIDFVLSREGQRLLESLDVMPARPDIDAAILKAFKGTKIYPVDMSLGEKFNDYSKQFAEVLKLP